MAQPVFLNWIYAMVDLYYWTSRSQHTVWVRLQGVGGHSSPLIIVCTMPPPLQPAEAGGCMRSSHQRLHHSSFPSTEFCIVIFSFFFCQEVDLMKIFGCNIFLTISCSGHGNLQKTGSEICNINLDQLSYSENWITLKMKTLLHSYFMFWYFIIEFFNQCTFAFEHWFSSFCIVFICITIDRQSNHFSHISHRPVCICFILNKYGTGNSIWSGKLNFTKHSVVYNSTGKQCSLIFSGMIKMWENCKM